MARQFDPFKIPELTREELIALQLTAEGKAEPHQQVAAIKAIVEKLCLADALTYQAGSFDESAFLAGRVFVAKQIFVHRRKPVGEPTDERDSRRDE